MKPIDLSALIKGLLTVIGISMALGKYGQLAAWARKETLRMRLVPVKQVTIGRSSDGNIAVKQKARGLAKY